MSKRDIHSQITNNIITLLERVDMKDYRAPFASLAEQGLPTNGTTGENYNGINIPNLWVEQQVKGFQSAKWATFKQWLSIGATVKKGEKASQIVFFRALEKTETDDNGKEREFKIPMLKTFSVFNADQVDGYSDPDATKEAGPDLVERVETVESYCQNTKAEIRHGGSSAYYSLSDDYIQMPHTQAFRDTTFSTATEAYHSVLLHELTHLTGSKKRLNRDQVSVKVDKAKYAFEELVAELGAAFMCAKFEIKQAAREDHALYIKSWLAALKNDNTFIFKAAAEASKAVQFLDALQPEAE